MTRAATGYQPAIYALKSLHADLGGKIKDNRTEAKRLAEDMWHVEAVLKMIAPDFDPTSIAARRRYKRHAPYKRGKGGQYVMDILRRATEPMTSRQITVALLKERGNSDPAPAAIRHMIGSVHSTLRRHVGKSVEPVGEGMPVKWRLV